MAAKRFNGEELRSIRTSKGIELTAISEKTRISRRYLEYIESDNYACLPAIVYTKGYLEQYAKCLCLDVNEVTMCYIGYFAEWLNSRARMASVGRTAPRI